MSLKKKSKLEKIGDVQLFNIIKLIFKNLNDLDYELNMRNDEFTDACHQAMNFVGLKVETPIDENYIYSCIMINREDINFKDKLPTSKLERPKASLYSYIVKADETLYKTTNYAHEIVSYSQDIVIETARLAYEKGKHWYDEGEIVDEDIYDSNTNDIEYLEDSVRKIKN